MCPSDTPEKNLPVSTAYQAGVATKTALSQKRVETLIGCQANYEIKLK